MPHRLVRKLRNHRKLHKYFGITLVLLIFISCATGIILAWKKNIAFLQPVTQTGTNINPNAWKSFAELIAIAQHALDSAAGPTGNKIDRIDARPQDGIVKVLFINGYWEVQLDATSGAVRSIERRHADWIEKVHDGSIISDGFKLVTMNVLGWGLFIMMFTGFWLWYGPRIIRGSRYR